MTEILNRVAEALPADSRAYVVGGYVRDMLLGRKTADIDIAVSGDCATAAEQVARALGGKDIVLDTVNGVVRVVLLDEGKHQFDFCPLPQGIEADLRRRDFTIDAMAIDLKEPVSGKTTVIDPYGGRDDLSRKLVRAMSEEVLTADPARLLRGVRLAAELGFSIEVNTREWLKRHSQLIATVAGERLHEDLMRLLSAAGVSSHVRSLDQLDLLTQMIPELNDARGVEQLGEHHWDVYHHLLETVAAVEFLLRQGDWSYTDRDILDLAPWSPELSDYFSANVGPDSTRSGLLKLSALLHDVAKPKTRTVDPDGRTRFLGHGQEGAEMAAGILARLRFSNQEIKVVERAIYYHLRPAQMTGDGLPSARAVFRFFRDSEGMGIDTLFLALADFLATRGPNLDIQDWRYVCRLVHHILGEYSRQAASRPRRLVTGHDLMAALGLPPGPQVGELLDLVTEAQVAGEIGTREEALALAREKSAAHDSVKELR